MIVFGTECTAQSKRVCDNKYILCEEDTQSVCVCIENWVNCLVYSNCYEEYKDIIEGLCVKNNCNLEVCSTKEADEKIKKLNTYVIIIFVCTASSVFICLLLILRFYFDLQKLKIKEQERQYAKL